MPDEFQELPPRPRRRLLTPVPLALFGVLLITCGFIAGVLVEKSQGSSSTSTSSGGLASRLQALRSDARGAGIARGVSGGSGAGVFVGGDAAGGAGATVGQVAYVSGHTLYVTNSEGNTVKVTTSVASTVTKTVKADIEGIHPGETVIVTGSTGAHGEISAESIRVGGGLGAGGLAGLFGGSGGRGGERLGGGARARSGEEPALFGRGG